MTTPVRIRQRIRQLEGQGSDHTRIARELGVSRTTVIKYATRDYSPSSTGGRAATRSLMTGEYARAADEWPASDLRLPRKQRHTARRVHERLVAELGFPGEYSSVQRWVKQWREAHRRESDGFAELEWAPGVAQVDFGQARVVVAGMERTVHFLAVSFPYSNMRYVAALPGETAECVCHGLSMVFAHMGMAPRVLVSGRRHGRRTPRLGRYGRANAPVLLVLCASRVRGAVLQPVFGTRERQRRERGRVRATQPDGARTLGRGMGRAGARVAGQMRRDRGTGALPPGRADTRPVRNGPGSHAPAAGHAVRRMRLAERENGPHRHGPGSTATGTSPARNGIPCSSGLASGLWTSSCGAWTANTS